MQEDKGMCALEPPLQRHPVPPPITLQGTETSMGDGTCPGPWLCPLGELGQL